MEDEKQIGTGRSFKMVGAENEKEQRPDGV